MDLHFSFFIYRNSKKINYNNKGLSQNNCNNNNNKISCSFNSLDNNIYTFDKMNDVSTF